MTRILRIHLLGDFRLTYGNTPLLTVNTQRLQSLLAFLVLHRHTPQSRHHLAFLLWPDTPEAQAHTNLRTLLHRLRQALPEADRFLVADAQTVQWRLETPFALDVADFEQSLAQANSITTLQQAIDFYQGDLLPGCYDDWILPHRERLRQVFSQALEQLIIRLENEHDYPAAIRATQRLLRHDPLHEVTYRRLMRLHALNGDRAGVQQVYQDCLTTLRRELDVAPSPATRQVYERLAYIDTPITQRHNLPVQLIPFVGREEELAQLAQLLANSTCRLLTIVGPGGIGKTRLAIRAARAQIGLYLHGIYLASLAATLSAEFLVSALADALNFSFHGPEDPKIQLLNYLREKEMLLILDNFEHLLAPSEGGKPGGAGFLVEILTNAPEVKLLATSRERLNLPGEWLFEIEGLSTPPSISPLTGEDIAMKLETYSAVALFLQAARRAQSSFQLTVETQAAVAHLSRLVEGMPLALELAAGWVRSLSCAEIVRELEQNLSFLATSQRHVIERHQSMQAVFDHSWRLLSVEERRIFRQLSVFQGGFRREAAEQVAGASLPILAALVDKSLLRRQPSGRYDLHELLRQYAAARLSEEPEELQAVQERHSGYFMDFLWRQTEPLKGGRQSQAMAEMKPEIDNIRLAWNWAVARGRVTEIGRSALGWSIFYDIQGRYHELKGVCQQTVDKLESIWLNEVAEERKKETGIVFGFMLATQGALYLRLGELGGKSKELLQQGIILLRQLEARTELATALHYFGSLEVFLGEFTEAQALLQEGLALFREEQDQRGMGLCLAVLGMATGSLGQYAEAYQLLQQGVALLRTVDEQHYLGMSLGFLGDIVIQMGRLTEAKQLLQESLSITRALGDRWSMALCLNQLGVVTFLTGKDFWAEAKQLHQESLAISKELGEKYFSAISLNHLGRVHYALGEGQEATQSFMTALRMAIESRAAPVALDILIGLATPIVHPEVGVTGVALNLKEQAIEWLALVLSHPASRQDTKDRAARLLAELESQLPPQISAAARARGQTRSLEAVAAEILRLR
ncbi:MAG: tetratricopeptide repeat protein [Anaerolineales bacterium]|nr:tetratricopeptide repeat protein [Anaerolineales bacterium]